MKAMKVTAHHPKSYPKVLGATMASKAMKTMMKAQKSRKRRMRRMRTVVYGFNAKNAKVSFYYGRKPCTKTANELKMIVSTILPCLQAGVLASNAKQVIAHHF